MMIIYTEVSTFLFWQRLEVRTGPEGAEFSKVNYFPAASLIYFCAVIPASHVGTGSKITSLQLPAHSQVCRCPRQRAV